MEYPNFFNFDEKLKNEIEKLKKEHDDIKNHEYRMFFINTDNHKMGEEYFKQCRQFFKHFSDILSLLPQSKKINKVDVIHDFYAGCTKCGTYLNYKINEKSFAEKFPDEIEEMKNEYRELYEEGLKYVELGISTIHSFIDSKQLLFYYTWYCACFCKVKWIPEKEDYYIVGVIEENERYKKGEPTENLKNILIKNNKYIGFDENW